LLQTDDDLRRKPDPRVHLEMGLLRLIHAGRLAPLEELLADLGSATGNGGAAKSSSARASSPMASSAVAQAAKNELASAAVVGAGAPTTAALASSFFAACAT